MISIVIGTAFASDVSQLMGGSSLLSNLMPIALIMVVFYFLLLRPQQKKMKEHQGMIKALQKNDVIIVAGGIFGTVMKSDDDLTLEIEIAKGVKIKIRRDSVTEVIKDEKAKELVSLDDAENKKVKK